MPPAGTPGRPGSQGMRPRFFIGIGLSISHGESLGHNDHSNPHEQLIYAILRSEVSLQAAGHNRENSEPLWHFFGNNPHRTEISNAAPAVSEEALAKLIRPVDASLLHDKSKTGCTICLEDIKAGELAAWLPCNHWYHKSCVIPWLKKFDSCPICRASIEKGHEIGSDDSAHNNANEPDFRALGLIQRDGPFRVGQSSGSIPTSSFPSSLPQSRQEPACPGDQWDTSGLVKRWLGS